MATIHAQAHRSDPLLVRQRLPLLVGPIRRGTDWVLVNVEVVAGKVDEHFDSVDLHPEDLRVHLNLFNDALARKIVNSESLVKRAAKCTLGAGLLAEAHACHLCAVLPELSDAVILGHARDQ